MMFAENRVCKCYGYSSKKIIRMEIVYMFSEILNQYLEWLALARILTSRKIVMI